MKTLSLTEARTHLSHVMQEIGRGDEIAICGDEEDKPEVIAVITPYATWKKRQKRSLGSLRDKGSVTFSADFSVSEEILLQS
jgi:antitoxin (DNA-binding transcriptional repressor) of toxin-antitoxin stability system